MLEPDSTRDSLPVALQKRYAPEHNWILDFVSRILVEGFRTEGALLTAQDLVGCVDGAGAGMCTRCAGLFGVRSKRIAHVTWGFGASLDYRCCHRSSY